MQYLEELINHATPFMEGWHDLAHYRRVWKFAQQLQSQEGGDLGIIMAAVWLHDTGRKESIPDHPAIGARRAREFLPTIGFPAEKIEAVARAILIHDEHGAQTTIEEMIVYDADRLDCFTLSGILRCVLESARIGHDFLDKTKPISTLPEFLEAAEKYLRVAYAHLNTSTARDIADDLQVKNVDTFLRGAILEQIG